MGRIPYTLERADNVWRTHGNGSRVRELIPEPPSTYYYRQIFCCFFRDKHGVASIDAVGVDNATVGGQQDSPVGGQRKEGQPRPLCVIRVST